MDATAFSLLSNPTSLFLGETVCRLMPVASCKTPSFQHKNSSIKAYTANRGSSPLLKESVLGRAFKDDEFSTRSTSDGKSSRSDNLKALFKRIQVEISQGDSRSGKYSKSSKASINGDLSVETSVLEFLQRSEREKKVEDSMLKRSEESNHKKKTTNKENSIPIPESAAPLFSRPPSNFVKKSPIPSTTPLRSKEIEVTNREELSLEADKESSEIEGMKLIELKELAKKRGIKGYSKLKKSDLVELLKS
ncbi:hypothetical protein SOVF_137120 isoform B [Spinacia oleracea]|uniref:SAP-like protein BP-73 isoform X2 n=1 Tax=Spinacia oleracea TaxID=3562 RepID=A0A9R0ITM9_SPIOL|nr:SAP-like protein BP-73 isoform X2 [Spinacia oleracea]KNA11229.1 hypothetical protein SOVF_137120 isoform B [Spinacia oleracea]